jgi:hypothetical protein
MIERIGVIVINRYCNRWSNESGTKYGNEMTDVAPVMPAGWVEVEQWHTIASNDDAAGWEYSVNFGTVAWYPKAQSPESKCHTGIMC